MRITNEGKVAIGSGVLSTPPDNLSLDGAMALKAQTADPDEDSTYAKLYAKGIFTTNLWAMDNDGNTTQLTSHQDPREIDPAAMSSFGDPAVALPFSFHHENRFTGKGAVVDLAAMVRDLEAETGKTYTTVYDIAPEEVTDYAGWQTQQQARLELEAREQILAETPEVEIPLSEAWEEVPETQVVEATEQVTEYELDLDTLTVSPVTVERKVLVEEPTGATKRWLKPNIRFDKETGKLYRHRSLDEVQIEPVPPPELPPWILDRLAQD